jgi:DNA modification methylase
MVKLPTIKPEEPWPISKIIPYPNNPRVHPPTQITLLASMLKRWGPDQPIVVDDAGIILKGHGRRLAAIEAGFDSFPVVQRIGLPDAEKTAMRIADNQVPLLSGWDHQLMQLEFKGLQLANYNLQTLGFSDFALNQIMAPLQQPEPEPEVIPPIPKNPITKRGDIWILGDHRILCGDCRDPGDVDRLMNGKNINVGFTSPPYAEQREYDHKSGFHPIPPAEYVEWFKPVAENVAKHLSPDGSWFINIKPAADGIDTELYVFDLILAHAREWGWHFATEYCWERIGVPKSVTRRFKNQFEPIYQFARGDWKMRPKSVMHASENVPIPFGPGAGQTSWKSGQGGNGPMFGAAAGRFNARPPGRRSGHPNDEKLQGKTDGNQNRRGRPHAEVPTTASKLQGIPGAYGKDAKRKRGFPTGEANQGTNWQSGAPLGVPQDQIVPGMAYPGNRLPTFAASHEATGHAAAFPVGLPGFFVQAYSDAGDAIYDPFLGSGSTLIAAEQHKRVGYGIEISAAYVDVCVARWERITGRKAERLKAKGNGASSRRRPARVAASD